MCAGPEFALLAGTLIGAGGKIQGGIAARSQGRAVAEREFIASGQELQEGVIEARGFRAATRALLGRQRASFAKAGVDISSGTPLLVAAETAAKREFDATRIEARAAQRAEDRVARGIVARRRGKQAFRQGLFGAAGTLLLGASLNSKFTAGSGPAVPGSAATPGSDFGLAAGLI
ncbi:MAG: hypothetical protein V3W41_22420 [Planctomycetota bacterium]